MRYRDQTHICYMQVKHFTYCSISLALSTASNFLLKWFLKTQSTRPQFSSHFNYKWLNFPHLVFKSHCSHKYLLYSLHEPRKEQINNIGKYIDKKEEQLSELHFMLSTTARSLLSHGPKPHIDISCVVLLSDLKIAQTSCPSIFNSGFQVLWSWTWRPSK